MVLDPVKDAEQLFNDCKQLAFSGFSIEPDPAIEKENAKHIAIKQIKFAERFMDGRESLFVVGTERGLTLADGTVMTSYMRYLERLKEEIQKL